MSKIEVRVDSRYPLFINADADSFGAVFANMNSEEQVAVLAAMVSHMEPHRTQWDYIAIELEKPENEQVRRTLHDILLAGGDRD
ncbi:hypothetical protein [Ochrobactrum sp. A-1]|uniref:hypothetical protein n=1 Tax=Ochrobactrum sp. A-1 TaxID=2920940 RepID=UPI001F0B07FF|nr:hypothetical protein [Ochrobactrum sp. A-1]